MKVLILLSLIAVASAASRYGGEQNPKVWSALRILRGGKDITTEEQQQLLINAVPGQDYPINVVIPASASADCSKYSQAGFYADTSADSRCQVFHRCDVNGELTSYLCPNQTLFNQITLVCDWFFNVDCSQSANFQDYSNSRLYKETAVLLDNEGVVGTKVNAVQPPLGGNWVFVPPAATA